MSDLFANALDALLQDACTPEQLRAIDQGAPTTALWATLQEAGFLDLLVPEHAGGAGLSLRQATACLQLIGRHLVPLPLAETLWVRGLMAHLGEAPPDGAIALASSLGHEGDVWWCHDVPTARDAHWVLAQGADALWLLPTNAAEHATSGVPGSLRSHFRWASHPADAHALPATHDLLMVGAALAAARIAGALERVMTLTLTYANDRVQFGKSIGKFQAVQQQLSVLAEHTYAARMAAEIGCASDSLAPAADAAAVAKARTSEAACLVSAIAHAVHGAIGITSEYDLQLATRRLYDWRTDHGAETYWQRRIGAHHLASARPALQFVLSTGGALDLSMAHHD